MTPKKRKPHVDMELTIIGPDRETGLFVAEFTRYEDDVAQWHITAAANEFWKLLSTVKTADALAEEGRQADKLLLPEQGDWQIQYFSTR